MPIDDSVPKSDYDDVVLHGSYGVRRLALPRISEHPGELLGTLASMARPSLWEVFVDALGLRRARRLAGFLECWATTYRSWQEDPPADQLASYGVGLYRRRGRVLPPGVPAGMPAREVPARTAAPSGGAKR